MRRRRGRRGDVSVWVKIFKERMRFVLETGEQCGSGPILLLHLLVCGGVVREEREDRQTGQVWRRELRQDFFMAARATPGRKRHNNNSSTSSASSSSSLFYENASTNALARLIFTILIIRNSSRPFFQTRLLLCFSSRT